MCAMHYQKYLFYVYVQIHAENLLYNNNSFIKQKFEIALTLYYCIVWRAKYGNFIYVCDSHFWQILETMAA